MSWNASIVEHRDKLWPAIDAMTAEQPGADPQEVFNQLHHAKSAAKAIANAFPAGEFPFLSISISGHAYVEGTAQPFISVNVGPPYVAPETVEAESASVSAEGAPASETGDTQTTQPLSDQPEGSNGSEEKTDIEPATTS